LSTLINDILAGSKASNFGPSKHRQQNLQPGEPHGSIWELSYETHRESAAVRRCAGGTSGGHFHRRISAFGFVDKCGEQPDPDRRL
jgi:hypothetical protein